MPKTTVYCMAWTMAENGGLLRFNMAVCEGVFCIGGVVVPVSTWSCRLLHLLSAVRIVRIANALPPCLARTRAEWLGQRAATNQ